MEEDEKAPVLERLEALRKKIESEKFGFEGERINVTITIGATKSVDEISLEKWVEETDEKMYSGKKSGKNKVVY